MEQPKLGPTKISKTFGPPVVWFGGFGFWFGIFFHIGKEDRLRTIGFPQEKLQFPRNSHWKWDLDNLWTEREAYRPGMRQEPGILFSCKVRPMWGVPEEEMEFDSDFFTSYFLFIFQSLRKSQNRTGSSDRSRQLSSSSCT